MEALVKSRNIWWVWSDKHCYARRSPNSKVPKSLERVEWFGWLFACSYQHFVRYSLKLQNMFFLGWHCQHRLSANQTVKCFMLNKSENYVKCHVGFLLPLKLQNICYFGLWPQNTLGQSICRMFYFWLFDNHNAIVYCYIVLILIVSK